MRSPIFFLILVVVSVVSLAFFADKTNTNLLNQQKSGNFSTSTFGLSSAKPQETVNLKNGETYDLRASIVKKEINGKELKMLAYNGSIPGPVIKVPQDATITLRLVNNTDVSTALHSHGVRLENKFDGVVDVTQKEIKPGESFTYKISFPDPGVYWYHPHFREDYAQELGLYGNFIVNPKQKDYWAEVDREIPIFLDDILIQNSVIAPFSRSTVDYTLMGRFGNVMLTNGSDNYSLKVKQGERVRFYFTNAANTRIFNVSIPNTRMKLVGADNGKYEREQWLDSFVLGPSERVVVEVWFDKAGDYQIVHNTPTDTYKLGNISVSENPVTISYFLIPRVNQDFIDSLLPFRDLLSKPKDKSITISLDFNGMMNNQSGGSGMHPPSREASEGFHMLPDGSMMRNDSMMMSLGNSDSDDVEWEDTMPMMNSMSNSKNTKWKFIEDLTKLENMDISWQFQKGDKVKLSISNDPKSMHPMQHPIHIHGQRFLIASINGELNQNLVWKDTVLVKTGDRVDLLVDMDNPGTWLIHCHIPEHMESGMITKFFVI